MHARGSLLGELKRASLPADHGRSFQHYLAGGLRLLVIHMMCAVAFGHQLELFAKRTTRKGSTSIANGRPT